MRVALIYWRILTAVCCLLALGCAVYAWQANKPEAACVMLSAALMCGASFFFATLTATKP